MSAFDRSTNNISKTYFSLSSFAVPITLALLLIIVSNFNFLLFHTLAEFFAITIAILTCVVAWNTYPFTRNNYLMYLGVGYFWIGILDLLHALAYKDMGVISDGGVNMAVKFWIGTRYLEALLLLSAPWFLTHSFQRFRAFIAFGLISFVIIFLVFSGIFPEGFIEGKGLTTFKVYSEYAIIILLVLSVNYHYRRRKFIDDQVVKVIITSIVLTMCAELTFTFYISIYGISNIAGHFFKLFSFWLIFQAIIRTTLQTPFLVMSRGASTYDAIPDATIVVDENGIIHQANNAACQLLNKPIDKIVGNNNHELLHLKNVMIEDCPICQAIVNNIELRGYEIENRETGKWFDITLSHITGAADLNGTVEVVRDITQRKITEKKVAELDILKNSIVENLPSMVFVKDAVDHRYIEWNKAAEELTGMLKEEMLGKNDFDFWPEKEAQFFIDKDKEVIKSKKLLDIKEEPLTTKYNGTRTLHTKKIPIYDTRGDAKYLLGISDDITDKLKTEEMLRRSQKMEAVGQMSGGIAHDFNNQLGIILGYTDLLSEQAVTETQLSWLNLVRDAGQRCSDLTRQLLSFSRSGNADREKVNVNDLISEMEVMIQRSLTPEVEVKYFLTNDLWQTEISSGAFKDTLLNLVLNARDAMPDGGSLTIETSNIVLTKNSVKAFPNIKEGEFIEIMVSDSGHGMTQEVFEHVFEPFFTTKDVGKGTGLGLSMVYGFTQRYGGDILLETNPDQGATFRIYLPCIKETNTTLAETSDKNKSYKKGNEKILVVDDEAPLLTFAEQILESWGYTVYCANNAADALAILKKEKIDLLFSDVVMPGKMNGYELAEKAHELNPQLKILITSGYADKFGGNEKYEKYGFELISKPYDREELADRLRYLLDNQ